MNPGTASPTTDPDRMGSPPPAHASGLLALLFQRALLTDLDLHFARFMERLAGGDAPGLALAAALASHATGQGDICVNLRQWAQRWKAIAGASPDVASPPTSDWLAAVRASPVVGRPGMRQPLVLDRRGRLYLYRYWRYEQQLADDLRRRAAASEPVDAPQLRIDLERLFPRHPHLIGPDWQKIAAATAALKRVCVISGGPGTGKTAPY